LADTERNQPTIAPFANAMSFTQLNPPLPLTVLDKGKGYAIGVIDYGQEHNLIWVTALDESGEIWCAPNPKVRFQPNWTMGRGNQPADDGKLPKAC
jgi:hypothetical protein